MITVNYKSGNSTNHTITMEGKVNSETERIFLSQIEKITSIDVSGRENQFIIALFEGTIPSSTKAVNFWYGDIAKQIITSLIT